MHCREHKRKTFDSIRNFGVWQAVILLFVGFLGGIFSAIAGSGVDICSFSILSLLFRLIMQFWFKKVLLLMSQDKRESLHTHLHCPHGYKHSLWYIFIA